MGREGGEEGEEGRRGRKKSGKEEETRSTTTNLVKLLKVRLYTHRGCIDMDLVFRSSCHGSSSTSVINTTSQRPSLGVLQLGNETENVLLTDPGIGKPLGKSLAP